MSCAVVPWAQWYRVAQEQGFGHITALKAQVDQLAAGQSSSPTLARTLQPIVVTANGRVFLVMKGVLCTSAGVPVEIAITVTSAFPNSYPVIAIEQPPPTHIIVPHPNVDVKGVCYLPSVSAWNPRSSSLAASVSELYRGFSERQPFGLRGGGGGAAAPAAAAPSGGGGDRVDPCSWDQIKQALPRIDPVRAPRIQRHFDAVRAACREAIPHVATIGGVTVPVLKVVIEIAAGRPSVNVIITMPQGFPDAIPVFTVEPPPAGWAIRQCPQLNTSGQVFLATLSRWDPARSDLVQSLSEMKQACTANYPFVPQSQPQQQAYYPAPVAAVAPAVPQQPYRPAAGPVSPAGSPAPVTVAPAYRQPQYPSSPPQAAPAAPAATSATTTTSGGGSGDRMSQSELAAALRAIEESERMRMATAASVASSPSSSRPSGGGDVDEATEVALAISAVEEAQRRGYRPPAAGGASAASMSAAPAAVPATIRMDLFSSPAAPAAQATSPGPELPRKVLSDTDLATLLALGNDSREAVRMPVAFGLPALQLTTADLPLKLFGLCPLPLQPVTDPTPEDAYEASKAPAAAPASSGWLGSAVSGLRKTVGAVEDKARGSEKEKDLARFQRLFSALQGTHALVTDYKCKTMRGNGREAEGHMMILSLQMSTSKFSLAFSTSDASFQFVLPLEMVVTIAKGQLCGTEFLSLVTVENDVRVLHGFAASTLSTIGSYVSASHGGTPFSRAYNWLDHCWRAAASRIPHAAYRNYAGGSGSAGFASAPTMAGPSVATTAGGGGQAPDPSCVVCMDQPKSAFFQPCGHIAVCMNCAPQCRTCPVCRGPVVQVFKAFIS